MNKLRTGLPALGLLAACALLLAGCQRPGNARVVIVPNVPSDTGHGTSQSAQSGMLLAPVMPQPRITIDPRDTVLQVINAALRKGAQEEQQVVAVKRMTEVDSPVRVLVVDTDPERGTYFFQSWESPTDATDNRIFSLAVKDLVGDHDPQIVASGMNKDGKLTLDVFRRSQDPHGTELVYAPVCQIVADDIHVEESDRPDTYTTDQKNGDSFPIDTYVRDPDSQDVMDLLKISYQWVPKEGRYVPGSPEKVPGEKAAQAQLSKLFSDLTPGPFEDFLAGSWLETPADDTRADPKVARSEISFDPRSREIVLSSGDTAEVYSWQVTARTLYNSARIVGNNETVPQIGRTFEITALSMLTLSVTVVGDDSTDRVTMSTYSRVSDQLQAAPHRNQGAPEVQQPPTLAGQYSGSNGVSVDFQYPRLLWKDSGGRRSAEYVLFPLAGRFILSVRFLGENNAPEEDQSWVVDFSESKNPARILRTLTLSPAQLTVRGYEDAVGDSISLQQEIDLRPR